MPLNMMEKELFVSPVICHCHLFDGKLTWMSESSSCLPTNQPPPSGSKHDGRGSEVALMHPVSDSWWRYWWKDALPLFHHPSPSFFFSPRSFRLSCARPFICLSVSSTNQCCQRDGPIKLFKGVQRVYVRKTNKREWKFMNTSRQLCLN